MDLKDFFLQQRMVYWLSEQACVLTVLFTSWGKHSWSTVIAVINSLSYWQLRRSESCFLEPGSLNKIQPTFPARPTGLPFSQSHANPGEWLSRYIPRGNWMPCLFFFINRSLPYTVHFFLSFFFFTFSTSHIFWKLEDKCFIILYDFVLYKQCESAITIYIYIIYILLLEPPSYPLNPVPLGHHRPPSWAPCFMQQLPTSYLFHMW